MNFLKGQFLNMLLKLMNIVYYNTVWMTYINGIKSENWNEENEKNENKVKKLKFKYFQLILIKYYYICFIGSRSKNHINKTY